MAIVNEVIVTGRVKRRLIDQAAKLWQRLSYWTKASDVEFDDGKTAEQKLGDINGITSDFFIDNEKIAASSLLTNKAYKRFNEFTDDGKITRLLIGDDGKPYIEYKAGADTVLKKLGNIEISGNTVDVLARIKGKTPWNYEAYPRDPYETYGITINQNHINNDYKFYVMNVSVAGSFETTVSEIATMKTGKNAILIQYDSTSAGSINPGHPEYSCTMVTATYIIPPQEIGTVLNATIKGAFTFNIFGVKQ